MASQVAVWESDELFSGADGDFSPTGSRCGSPEIPIQNRSEYLSTSQAYDQGTGFNDGVSLGRSPLKMHTTIAASSSEKSKSRPNSTSGHTPQGRSGKQLNPWKIMVNPDYADGRSSDSDEESARRCVQERKRRRQHSPNPNENSLQMESIEDIKAILVSLCKKVDQNNRALKQIKQDQHSSTGGSGCSSKSPKRTISLNVRKEVRRCYKALLDDHEGDGFQEWCIEPGVSIKADENQSVIRRLVKEVQGLNPTFDAADIREAAYRFYKTKCEEESLKRTGKDVQKKRTKRRHERITRKRKERESAILKNSKLTEDQKKKWLTVMTNDYMSSEESGVDDSIIVHPLPWRSEYVDKMFRMIDAYCEKRKSPQAKRQMKPRVYGMTSSRQQPAVDETVSRWAIVREVLPSC